MKPRLQKILLIILFALTFATVGSMTFLEEYFYRTRPRLPDPAAGRLYVQDVKSARGVAQVYLTRAEKLPFDFVWYINPILVAAIIATAYVLVSKKRRHLRPPTPE